MKKRIVIALACLCVWWLWGWLFGSGEMPAPRTEWSVTSTPG